MDRVLSTSRLLLLGVIAVWSASAASAAMLGLTAQTSASPASSDGYTVGYEFLTGSSPLTVTGLGVWDEANPLSPGFRESHEIAIWTTAGGTPLADETIGPSTYGVQINAWYFVPIDTFIVLAPNTDYVIGVFDGTGGTGGEKYHGSQFSTLTPVFNTPDVTFVERRLDADADAAAKTFEFPFRSLGAGSAWDMPNFTFGDPLPEPASLSLVGVGSLAALARRRRR